MYAVRRWSVRHARGLSRSYASFEALLVRLAPLLERIGYPRLERSSGGTDIQENLLVFHGHI